MYKAQKINN